jgi:hypothetical protein
VTALRMPDHLGRAIAYAGALLASAGLGVVIALHGVLAGVILGSPSTVPPAGTPIGEDPSCPAHRTLIGVENCRTGTPGWELTQPANSGQIMGYAWQTSALAGETLSFSVSTSAQSFDADIYRMGWYQGAGARLVLSKIALRGHVYPVPAPNSITGIVACHWPAALHVTIPKTWVSGIYLLELTAFTGYQAYVSFVVRDTRPSKFVFVHAVNTDEAYNTWGGKSLYKDVNVPSKDAYARRAVEVSFDRPFTENFGAGDFLYWEYPMVRWLEENGYDVSYVSDVDVHENLNALMHHRVILVVGHNEYWSEEMRNHYQSAVASGVSLGAFAADTGAWAIRYRASPTTGRDRVIVCYKYPDGADPYVGVDTSRVTAEWRNPILHRPESLLLGGMYAGIEDPTKSAAWVASRASSSLFGGRARFKGLRLPGLVGYEFDSVIPGYPVPPHLTVLSSSPVTDYRGKHGTANSTIYTARSRARVFNAGTIQWSWGLDGYVAPWQDRRTEPYWPNPVVQRVTVGLLDLLDGGKRSAR